MGGGSGAVARGTGTGDSDSDSVSRRRGGESDGVSPSSSSPRSDPSKPWAQRRNDVDGETAELDTASRGGINRRPHRMS